jgi:hypothetical protein
MAHGVWLLNSVYSYAISDQPYAIRHKLYAISDNVYLPARLAFQLPPEPTFPSMTLPFT